MTKIKLKESELRNIIQKVIKESTDLDKYEDVVFLQGEEANEALDILNNEGKDAAMDYLIQWHDPGSHMGKNELGVGTSDQTYRRDGYIMSWNSSIGYIGLDYDLSMMNESMFDGVSVNGNFNVDTVLESYLETLLRVDEELDGRAIIDIAPESVQKAKKDVELFISKINENPQAQEEAETYDDKSLGHNLALSRNGHGAGFSDEYNDTLQDIARGMGESDIYIGDDGILYIYPHSVNESKKKRKKSLKENENSNNIKIKYGSPGMPWDAEIVNVVKDGNHYILEIVDADGDGEREIKIHERLYNKLMGTGQVQYTNKNGGYVEIIIPELYDEEQEEDDVDFSDLKTPDPDSNVSYKQSGSSYPLGVQESKKTTKIKLSELKKLIESVIVEEIGDNEFNVDEPEEEFVPHGSYTVSNTGGYLIMLSDDGETAKVKDAFGSDNPKISDWLEIEYVDDEDEPGELMAVIDPEGYNIPLNQVMIINR